MPDNTGLFTIHSDSEGSTEVQLRPLDDLVAEQNPVEIAYIKIDVEGNELNTIKGAKRTLEQHAPAVEVEINHHMLHVAGRDHDEIVQYMNSLGYETYLYTDNELARWEMTNAGGLTQVLGKLPNRIQAVFETVPFVDTTEENTVRDVIFISGN
jgi:hypothetical protein